MTNNDLFNLIPLSSYHGSYLEDVKKLKLLKRIFYIIPIILIIIATSIPHKGKSRQDAKPSNNESFYKTSFDCSKSNNYVEKTICSNSDLAKLDLKLAGVYQAKLAKTKNKQKLQTQQKNWVLNTKNVCTDEQCITDVIVARIKALSNK